MAIRVLAAAALLVAVACSSSADKARTSATTEPGTNSGSQVGNVDPSTSPERLTDADCMALLDHYLTVAAAEKPEEARPTSEQLAEIRSGMVDAAKQDCVGQPRSGSYECAMQATSSQAIGTCLSDAGGPK